jgi:hypothetical protein
MREIKTRNNLIGHIKNLKDITKKINKVILDGGVNNKIHI